ncbi:MAG: peptide MFS transporter [Myxococcota bacterium]
MWERFSYYGMRGLLRAYMMYYLLSTFGSHVYPDTAAAVVPNEAASDPHGVVGLGALTWVLRNVFFYSTDTVSDFASGTYGTYTGLVYATPFIGGLIADRWLGQRRAVYIGAVLMAIGHFVMASEQMFIVALLLLIVGNGFFKPNISTQVGDLYEQGDVRRDGAFTIFYMGINLGAFLSNLACGTLAAVWGWHYGFGAAGVGLCIGLVFYYFGRKYLVPEKPKSAAVVDAAAGAGPLSTEEWRRVGALVALCLLNVAFWAVYEQQGNTMQTWADTQTHWPVILGFQIPQNWFQSFNPFMIFVLAPLLDMFWRWQAARGQEPTSVAKMAIGSILLGLSFLIMAAGASLIGDGKGSLFWPFACTLILTVGELYLSPIGLSLVTKVSPARIVSMMMGIWLGSSFLGNILSGQIGTLYDDMTKTAFFLLLCAIGVVTGLAMWAFNRPLKDALGHH